MHCIRMGYFFLLDKNIPITLFYLLPFYKIKKKKQYHALSR